MLEQLIKDRLIQMCIEYMKEDLEAKSKTESKYINHCFSVDGGFILALFERKSKSNFELIHFTDCEGNIIEKESISELLSYE